ncbi:3-(3-hydroxy-phenyl)propionate hydroxylase [Paracoccus thiocyanatus]|uniref:3-(3-hydroxy-phenyl)propionate hydroxylase n=1 Tax=Paracoccus thiocyanatus TaxID=34006 RepID=A0A1N6YWC0_9RHOB|nr:FAD-dependent monooxygenase [Paracoccus thiocyanatus]SIR18897.1 3-(3-hydroxy-phenyl)propionate hydroxylase [Paracoccus thiocyanatus]
MRPDGRGETESLYFDYPYFEPPQQRGELAEPTPVAIVGAGPVGLTAALQLASEGIRSVVFDNKPTFNDGSRAICISRSSLAILDRLGVAAPFLEKSLGWTTGQSFYRGQKILEFKMPDGADEKFRPMYNLQQQYIEAFLWQAVAAHPLIQTRWQSEVVGIDRPGKIALRVSDPAGSYEIKADWCLACDGARSPIRKMRGKRLKGENFEGRYVIADIRADIDFPTIRRALFDPACRPGGTVLIHRQPDDIWRIDYQLRDEESEADAVLEQNVRASVQAVLDETGYSGTWDLEWWSIYSANTLALDDYRDGRVFFVGDSAHIVPIFGVRGLNNGLADAVNIGWKLGWVLQGRAGEALLDTYSPERRGATLDVFANASKSARFMTPSTHGWRLMRDAALSLALRHSFAGEFANPRQMVPYSYTESAAVRSDAGGLKAGPAPGEHLPELRLGDGFLSDHLGPGFTLLCFDAALASAVEARNIEGLSAFALPVSLQASERIAHEPGAAYLVRPDLYVAARWSRATPDEVASTFAELTFRKGNQL